MQLECIACTQCIDACNGVMARIGRAPNLIGYRSLVGLERTRAVRLLRPRVGVYAALLVAIVAVFATALARRELLDLYVGHNQANLFGSSADGRGSNAYVLHITNRDRKDHLLRVRLDAPPEYELVAGVNPMTVSATSAVEESVFVLRNEAMHEHAEEAAEGRGGAEHELRFVLEPVDDPARAIVRSIRFFERPSSRYHGGDHVD